MSQPRRKQSKKHDAPGQVAIAGVHPVRVVLSQSRVSEIWIRDGANEHRLRDLVAIANSQGVRVIEVASRDFDQAVASDTNHQGVMAFTKPREMEPENALPILLDGLDNPLVLILDGVTDPHNFGACLRSAEAFGATCVIVPKDNAAPLNQVARKTSSGASELIPVVKVTNLARCLRGLQQDGFWVVGAAGESTVGLDEASHNGPMALVMGSEGGGLRRLTREVCDALVAIPMPGHIESLNVSVATGVLLYDLQNRRGALDASRAYEERV
ncbi:MAG: 23S rRNA (guanosine(2251)-2'-O)-methyltransferase RlmB [Gammaproteobacteria bacterium]|jgi:23S rRNA (guanosine2251-2'-O)-methyltransferase|nr:23S rRNA (guanosine(2251)-2'-O)-methyltransferase RlmB [Gammaproteobacteria bacterium]